TGFLRVPRRTSRTTVPVSRRMRIQPHDEFNNTTDPRKRAQQEVEKARKERLLRNFDSYTNLLQMYFESKGSTQDRLRRASQERDEAWQLELDAVLKLQSLDSTTSDDTGSPRLSIMEPRMVAES
ncbi:hypothetical protein MKW94_018333, partial [Papaver nudicaule]|nr:hypothetical protein [Papaver nudicaule]MCL7040187.1 hypothetical protein [Papaver nudicaule]